MIEATYTLNIDDLMEAGQATFARELSITRYRAQWVVIGMGLIAVVLTQKPSALYWLIGFGLFLIWSAITYPGQRLRRHFRKSVTNEEVLAQISEAGITTESATSRTEMKWAGFRSMVETPKTIALLTIANILYVFPKRAFNEQSCQEFRKLIGKNGISLNPR